MNGVMYCRKCKQVRLMPVVRHCSSCGAALVGLPVDMKEFIRMSSADKSDMIQAARAL